MKAEVHHMSKLLQHLKPLALSAFLGCLSLLPVAVANTSPPLVDVVIMGGGLSGLTAAYELKKKNISYKILEWAPRVGGRVKSIGYPDSAPVSAGLEEFWESNPALKMVTELKLPTESVSGYSSVRLSGKLYPYVQSSLDAYLKTFFSDTEIQALKKWDHMMAQLNEQIAQRKLKPLWHLIDVSFADWIKKNGLPVNVQNWVRVMLEPEIGTEWDQISALDGIAEWHIFLHGGEEAYHVVGGNQGLTEALANHVGREHIHLNHQVTRVSNQANEVQIQALDHGHMQNNPFRARYFISAIPLFRLNEVQFDPPISNQRREAIATQGWGAYFKAHVFFKPGAEKYWTQKGTPILPILTDSPLGVIYDGNEDQKNRQVRVLSLLVTGSNAEQFSGRTLSLDQVRDTLKAEFEKLWPGSSKDIQRMEFWRLHPRAIAAWPVGRSRFDALSESLRKPDGRVYFAGDYTESSHSDGAVYSALRVTSDIAARIAQEKKP